VGAAVIDGLDPGGEQPVQLVKIGDLVPALICAVAGGGLAGDLDEELLTDGPEEAFDLASALRLSG
jgi:hypothetical protein